MTAYDREFEAGAASLDDVKPVTPRSVYDEPEPMPGQVAYEASCATFPPKQRKMQVPYRDIGEEPQRHWEIIAQAVLSKFGGSR